jgi:hypothetical protein
MIRIAQYRKASVKLLWRSCVEFPDKFVQAVVIDVLVSCVGTEAERPALLIIRVLAF